MSRRITNLLIACSASLFVLAPSAFSQRGRVTIGKSTHSGDYSVSVGSGGLDVAFSSRRSRGRGGAARAGRGFRKRDAYRSCRWIPGHNETIKEKVWIPGAERRVWVEPRYETWCDQFGRRRQRLIRNGYWELDREPGFYDYRSRRVWVDGRYGCSHRHHRRGHYAGGYARFKID